MTPRPADDAMVRANPVAVSVEAVERLFGADAGPAWRLA